MQILNRPFLDYGLSDRTIYVITASCRESTRDSTDICQKMGVFCFRTNTSYDSATITECWSSGHPSFHEGLSYSAINFARSALSNNLGRGSDHLPIGSHPLVSKLMRGINSNSPRARYTHTWDLGIEFTMLRGWTPISGLTLDKLTYNMVMFMALVTAQRVQSL